MNKRNNDVKNVAVLSETVWSALQHVTGDCMIYKRMEGSKRETLFQARSSIR